MAWASSILNFDVYKLQVCRSESHFNAGRDLFLAKWLEKQDEDVNDFIEYFKEQWFTKEPNWYEGYNINNIYSSATNNGNESVNGVVKSSTSCCTYCKEGAWKATGE